ncbi:hypothetical protein H4219_006097 [Mycoemilia scoparia]|uniref:Uncharacterized protein n=1 Tax=Mycoemilia scoparia TaxID=417184 RepID=A0A9W7ZL73_9FUNG|nr:hypothetical protein H4219_006097 [Mycoemilia scoparia]
MNLLPDPYKLLIKDSDEFKISDFRGLAKKIMRIAQMKLYKVSTQMILDKVYAIKYSLNMLDYWIMDAKNLLEDVDDMDDREKMRMLLCLMPADWVDRDSVKSIESPNFVLHEMLFEYFRTGISREISSEMRYEDIYYMFYGHCLPDKSVSFSDEDDTDDDGLRTVSKSGNIDVQEMAELMSRMRLENPSSLPKPHPRRYRGRPRCTYCTSVKHKIIECEDLCADINKGIVKMVQGGLVAYTDGKLIKPDYKNGGMMKQARDLAEIKNLFKEEVKTASKALSGATNNSPPKKAEPDTKKSAEPIVIPTVTVANKFGALLDQEESESDDESYEFLTSTNTLGPASVVPRSAQSSKPKKKNKSKKGKKSKKSKKSSIDTSQNSEPQDKDDLSYPKRNYMELMVDQVLLKEAFDKAEYSDVDSEDTYEFSGFPGSEYFDGYNSEFDHDFRDYSLTREEANLKVICVFPRAVTRINDRDPWVIPNMPLYSFTYQDIIYFTYIEYGIDPKNMTFGDIAKKHPEYLKSLKIAAKRYLRLEKSKKEKEQVSKAFKQDIKNPNNGTSTTSTSTKQKQPPKQQEHLESIDDNTVDQEKAAMVADKIMNAPQKLSIENLLTLEDPAVKITSTDKHIRIKCGHTLNMQERLEEGKHHLNSNYTYRLISNKGIEVDVDPSFDSLLRRHTATVTINDVLDMNPRMSEFFLQIMDHVDATEPYISKNDEDRKLLIIALTMFNAEVPGITFGDLLDVSPSLRKKLAEILS